MVISLLFGALWGSIASNRHLLRPEVSEKEINANLLGTAPNIGFYVGVEARGVVNRRARTATKGA